jgi:1-deoxy-D-xylulose-5-phosphate synthase
MCLPDRFIEHGDYRDQLMEAGLTPGQIASTVLTTMGRAKEAMSFSLTDSQVASWSSRSGVA